MIQQMLAIWSLVPLPFRKPAWASGTSRFTYCWSLAWRILSITLLAWTVNFQMFKLDLEKAEEPEIKLQTSLGSSKKQESYRKTSTSVSLTMPNCGKFLKRWEYQTTLPASWEISIQVKNWIRNNRLVPNRKRSTSRLYVVILLI